MDLRVVASTSKSTTVSSDIEGDENLWPSCHKQQCTTCRSWSEQSNFQGGGGSATLAPHPKKTKKKNLSENPIELNNSVQYESTKKSGLLTEL